MSRRMYVYKPAEGSPGSLWHRSIPTRQDFLDAWRGPPVGQGAHQAREKAKNPSTVGFPVKDEQEALIVAALWCRLFNLHTCTYYDCRNVWLYCGDAGSESRLKERTIDLWGAYSRVGSSVFEMGPIFGDADEWPRIEEAPQESGEVGPA